jgi:hypothetical protein
MTRASWNANYAHYANAGVNTKTQRHKENKIKKLCVFVSSCLCVKYYNKNERMKKKKYVSPVVVIYRVALEGLVAGTTRIIKYTGIEVEEFEEGNTDNTASNDILLY